MAFLFIYRLVVRLILKIRARIFFYQTDTIIYCMRIRIVRCGAFQESPPFVKVTGKDFRPESFESTRVLKITTR